jgi:proteasome accessory factor C
MDKFDRIFQLHSILTNRRTPIDAETLQARLECSRATLFRIVALMKTHLNAPIESRDGGFVYRRSSTNENYELPGLWFSPAELQSLLVMQSVLRDLGAGLLEDQVAIMARRLQQLLQHRRLNVSEAATRIRFPPLAARRPGASFQIVASATLQRRQLWFEYHSRGSDRISERTVSPQRLTRYREAWYLDALDHSAGELRTFSMDRVMRPRVLEARAQDVSEAALDLHFGSGYGIFAGAATQMAVLRFTRERARWVADEQWHPQQQARFLEDGSYELSIPYADARELTMDILRHGDAVEVMGPPELRDAIAAQLERALSPYKRE